MRQDKFVELLQVQFRGNHLPAWASGHSLRPEILDFTRSDLATRKTGLRAIWRQIRCRGKTSNQLTVLFQSIIRTPAEKRRQETIDEARERNAKLFGLLDQHLAQSEYLAGAFFSIADIAIGPLAYRWMTLPVLRPRYDNLQRWYDLLCEREAFREHVIQIGLS